MNTSFHFPKVLIFALLITGAFSTKSYAALEALEPEALANISEVAPDAMEKDVTAPVHHRMTLPVSDKLFAKLWDTYPMGDADLVKSLIGGTVNAPWVVNTCPVRLSRSLNYSGRPVMPTPGLTLLRGDDKKHYAFRLTEFIGYLKKTFGHPTISVTLKDGEDHSKLTDAIRGHKGIIVFIVRGWTDASGHVDLWDGEATKNEEFFERASAVYLWE